MMRRLTALCSLLVATTAPLPAAAQSDAEFYEAFSGDWYVFDPARGAAGDICQITLAAEPRDGMRPVIARNCDAAVSALARWQIVSGQLVLSSATGGEVLELGGSQQRISGAFRETGFGMVLERGTGDAAAAALTGAIRRHRCYFLGYSPDCAEPDAAQRPAGPEAPAEGAEIETLVQLNVRTQPRRDAETLGAIPPSSCIVIDECLVASDGVWCAARFGDRRGWLAKMAVRQQEWPVLTYLNACTAGTEAAPEAEETTPEG